MDVLLTEEEEMLKNSARDFLQGECPSTLVREMEKDPQGYSPDLWKKMADLGWQSLAIPEAYGGQGLPLTYLGIVLEEIGRACAPVPFHSTMTAALAIAEFGTEDQKKDLLPKVANGEAVLSWAMLEKEPRFDAANVHLQAKAEGDGYVLNGTKMFVENAEASHRILVVARTGGADENGISLFLVDPNAGGVTNTPLVTIAKDRQSKLDFANVRVPKSALVGQEGQGWPLVEWMLERGTALLCAQVCGTARMHADLAIEYAKHRVVFGRPLGSFQAIAHPLADMVIWVDGAQLLACEALWRMDQGMPASIETSQAKAFLNDKVLQISHHANIIHGGIAFMREFDLNLWFRREVAGTMKLGTTYEHRAKVAKAILETPGYVRLGESMYELSSTPW